MELSEIPTIEKPKKNTLEIKEEDYNILDVGCEEIPYFYLAENNSKLDNFHYVGLDFKLDSLQKIQRKINNKNFHDTFRTNPKKIDFIGGYFNQQNLPFSEKVFNEVIFTNIFGIPANDFDEIKEFLKNGLFILKERGKLIIIETYTPKNALNFLEISEIKKFIKDNFTLIDNEYKFRNDEDGFILTLEKKHAEQNQN